MDVSYIEECAIGSSARNDIENLLSLVFGDGAGEASRYKPYPSFRLLVSERRHLVGHLAAEHRRMRIGHCHFPVFGISDLCVRPDWQNAGIGTRLLRRLEDLGRERKIDYLLSFADQPRFYEINGFEQKRLKCRWLFCYQGHSMGVLSRTLDGVMIKPIGWQDWPEGELDLLGHIF